MKSFKMNEEVLYLPDINSDKLNIGWVYSIQKSTSGATLLMIVENKEDLEKKIKPIDLTIKLASEAKKSKKGIERRYRNIIKLLNRKYIKKHLFTEKEIMLFLTKNNCRIRIITKFIFKRIWSWIIFFIRNFILGTIRLILGELYNYYPTIIKLNNKKELLKETIKEAKYWENKISSIESNEGNTIEIEVYKVMLDRSNKGAENIRKEIKGISVEVSETSRVIVATLIAIISLIVAITSQSKDSMNMIVQ